MARTAAPENPPCPHCGHRHTVGKGRTRGRPRWSCVGCGRSFGRTTGTPLYRVQTPPAEIARALLVVLRRGSLVAAEEVTGHKYETIGRWLRRAAAHADAVTAALVHDLQLTEVEVDEFWSFVRHKGGAAEATRPDPAAADGIGGAVGERWGCVRIDRPSRFVVAWAAGPRTATLAEVVVQMTRQRTAGQTGLAWISDGWASYAETIADVSCDAVPVTTGGRTWTVLRRTPGVRLTQAIKHRQGRRLRQVEVRATMGAPVAQPYTVHIERLNGVLRDRLACLTRKTHAFAKEATTWDAAVALALFEHNWIRPHSALRRPLPVPIHGRRYHRPTPAMALGLTDHRWSLVEFLTSPISHHARE